MIKIAHEAPKSIFELVESVTDYSYALVHLFEEDEEYYKQFETMQRQGREIILDNSVFELETAFDADKFVTWVEKLNPRWYIIPDVLENCEQTVANVKDWVKTYKDLRSSSIGVVQGKTKEEMIECYREIEPLVDKVAISFDYSFFKTQEETYPTKFHYYMTGRQKLIYELVRDDVININKPHHLLGCGLPQEFNSYRNCKWIDSLDTSNPVVAGIKGIRYNDIQGLEDKPSEKLFTLINYHPNDNQVEDIMFNIQSFRKIVGNV